MSGKIIWEFDPIKEANLNCRNQNMFSKNIPPFFLRHKQNCINSVSSIKYKIVSLTPKVLLICFEYNCLKASNL